MPLSLSILVTICAECLTIWHHSLPDCVMLSMFSWRKKVEVGDIQRDGFCFSKLQMKEPCCPGMTEHLPAHRSAKSKPSFAFLVCMTLAVLVKPSFFQPTSFLTFTFLILFPAPLGKAKQLLCGAESLAWVKPWHTKNLNMSTKTKVSIRDYIIPFFPSWLVNTAMEN